MHERYALTKEEDVVVDFRSLRTHAAPIAAGLLAAGWDALYFSILWQERQDGSQDFGEAAVWFVAGSVGAAAVFLVLSWRIHRRSVRGAGQAAATAALVGYALLAALSIGIFLVPAALLAARATSATLGPLPRAVASRALWTGVLVGLAFPAALLVAVPR